MKPAAKLLSDIKNVDTSTTEHLSAADVSSITNNLDYLPSSWVLFLRTLLERKTDPDLTIASFSQAWCRQNEQQYSSLPFRLLLGLPCTSRLAPKTLLNIQGLSEMCAAADQGTGLVGMNSNSWIQFVADNVDHQIRTLDRTCTFHGTGIIEADTPGSKRCKAVLRNLSISPEIMSAIGKVPIHYFKHSASNLSFAYEVLQYLVFMTKPGNQIFCGKFPGVSILHVQDSWGWCKLCAVETVQVRAALHFSPL